jgi:hypothetical protein
MKLQRVGFLKELNNNNVLVDRAKDLTGKPIDFSLKAQIIDYLDSGRGVMTYMSIAMDEAGNLIKPYKILTDGEWIWPSYFSYFLEKYPDLNIDAGFFEHMRRNNYRIKPLSAAELLEITNYYIAHPDLH